MSVTLTSTDAPADQPELNADEQESLALAEANESEQQQLLAGKFDSPASLEQAYLELQKKLGEPRDEVQATEDEGEPAETEPEETDNSDDSNADLLTDAQAEELYKMVGGEKEYRNMIDWAANSLSQDEIEMYDAVMATGNANSIYWAVQALNNKYTDSVGSEAPLLTGRGSSESNAAFRSQSELVQAMSDPRYDNDPAYRADVMAKLENSDLAF
tara:strand:+ start:3064 stop:3708 length:645 start_codon:yes stop_codon:yes gene_type:complete